MPHAAACEFVHERAQQEICVTGVHAWIRDVSGLVLLHGFTHTGASWRPVIASLPESMAPLAPDLRGHGASSGRRPVTLSAVLDDVGSIAPDRFVLVGYSMGGRIALHAALAMPERVSALVLVSASPGIADAGERDTRRRADERLADSIERGTIGEFARSWAKTPVLTGLSPDVEAAVHRDRLRCTTDGLASALRGLGTGVLPSLWERLCDVRMPVMVIAGGRDEKFCGIARQMAAALPSSHVEVIPGTGHAAHLERPRRIASVIADAVSATGDS